MKKKLAALTLLLLGMTTLFAKKVTVTIEGTTDSYETSLYLIVNEDTTNAQIILIDNGHFSVTVTVEQNSFIRIHDYKDWPERSLYVLIPDSRHITIDRRNGTIEGSPLSQRLQEAINEVNRCSPEGFHIDVFSDDPAVWEEARRSEMAMREQMENDQREKICELVNKNKDNIIPAWLCYCFADHFLGGIDEIARGSKHKWYKHPIIKKKLEKE